MPTTTRPAHRAEGPPRRDPRPAGSPAGRRAAATWPDGPSLAQVSATLRERALACLPVQPVRAAVVTR